MEQSLKQASHREENQMANKNMKTCLTLASHKKEFSIRLAKRYKSDNCKCW